MARNKHIADITITSQTVGMSPTRKYRLASLLVGITILASCTSMQGDLGRPERNDLLESTMQLIGEGRSKAMGELYSNFNGTDEEKLMRDRAWILIRPPHAQDWVSQDLWTFFPSLRYVALHVLTEVQRTRMTPVIDTAFEPKHYYRALRSTRYGSHHGRYDRVISDIEFDRDSLAAFIPVAEQVVKADQIRMAALGRAADMEPRELKDAYARVDENRRFIGWVWRAMQFRMRAYAYAIKRLEIETPSEKVRDANLALMALKRDFDRHNGALNAPTPNLDSQGIRRSRYSKRQWAKENPNLVK